jgi:Flp pilus assembly protein TadD
MRLSGLSVLAVAGAFAATAASAQQAEFNPTHCDGRTAQDCNDLMGSFSLKPEERQKVLMVRATALLQKHDLEGAIAEYREMTVIEPRSLVAYSTLGFLESVAEKWPEAVTDLRRAVEIAPGEGRLHGMLSVALAKGGDCVAAKTALTEAKAKIDEAPLLASVEQTVGEACR